MLSIFGWAFLIVWLVLGLRYGIPLGQEMHALLDQVRVGWGDTLASGQSVPCHVAAGIGHVWLYVRCRRTGDARRF